MSLAFVLAVAKYQWQHFWEVGFEFKAIIVNSRPDGENNFTLEHLKTGLLQTTIICNISYA